MKFRLISAVAVALLCVAVVVPQFAFVTGQASEMVIGVLIYRNPGASMGVEEAALKVAQDDINAYFADTGTLSRVRLVFVDTGRVPEKALDAIQQFQSQGIKVVIGPSSSAELAAIKPYADENGMLIVNYSSTAPGLAQKGDNLFRFVPDDTHQARAMAQYMQIDGLKAVLPVYRDDVYGAGLVKAIGDSLKGDGIDLLNGIPFSPGVTNLNDTIDAIVAALVAGNDTYGFGKVGVYLIGFSEEVQPIFEKASNQEILTLVRWYGSDAAAQQAPILDNISAAGFADQTGFPCPVFGQIGNLQQLLDMSEKVRDLTGLAPTDYALAAYDAAWVTALAEASTGGPVDIERTKSVLADTAEKYYGVTGSTALDENGDRRSGDYDFWAIRQEDEVYHWEQVATFTAYQPGGPENALHRLPGAKRGPGNGASDAIGNGNGGTEPQPPASPSTPPFVPGAPPATATPSSGVMQPVFPVPSWLNP